jgi:predicted PurR-regulated permease PerM
MTRRSEQQRLILWGIAMSLVGILTLGFLFVIRKVLLLLYVSTLLAIGFSPAVRWIERQRLTSRRRLPRWAAILVLYVGFLLLITILLLIVIPPLARQLNELWQRLPEYEDQFQQMLIRTGVIDHPWTGSELLQNIKSPGVALAGILGALRGVIGMFAALVTVLVLPYYLLVEAKWLQSLLLRLAAPERRQDVARLTRDVTLKVGAWLNGQILLSGVIGISSAIGLWILGVPYFYVLGLIAGIGEFVPIVGPIVASVPAILMGFTVSLKTGLLVAAYFLIQQIIENNVLVPRIMERQVGVSAVTIIVALLIGGELLGVIGAILAVPTAAIVQVILQEYFEREE